MSPQKRRGAGEGSIYQAANGRWYASLSIGHDATSRKRAVVSAKTRKEVIEKLKALKTSVESGTMPTEKGNVTVKTLLDEWLKLSVKPSLRPNTVAAYSHLCEKHIKPTLGHLKIKNVTPHIVQTLLENRQQVAGLSPRTTTLIRIVILLAFRQAVEWGWVSVNPVDKVRPPKQERGRSVPVAATPQEAARFAEVLRADRRGRPALVAIATGLRMGEVLGLRWSDIDMESAVLRVVGQLQLDSGNKAGSKWVLSPTKSASSVREVAVPAFLMAELVIQRDEQQLLGHQGDLDLVFTNNKGEPLAQDTARRWFHALFEQAGLAHIRFHDLRHIYASLLLARNTQLKLVSEILGHSNPSITITVYGHTLRGQAQDAARAIDGIMDPPKRKGGENGG